ncbi:tetratricopeptide repeat protein [Actinoplanes bogorensis]|uniref:Tetratricopeptide repeat protein n=1 Tax=Paractinoplanes bogorensis TaxID=1610840 RepID=A0ABS5YV16_9ACTN|nr:BTAD domain-containing putative transcriptional regulator [Actinoplanes bogorensis]MBU2665925.1 tetratricopeptide repeat protein [Actinoplanes bogorensis]
MRFEVLGPVRVITDDGSVAALAPRPRTLLAVLIAARGQVVSAERLMAELWPGEVPPSAATALQVHASAVRKVVGDRLSFTSGGYAVRAGELDALEFERTGDLRLWRGPAYEGTDAGPIVGAAAARLTEQLLAARLAWADQQLAEGRPVLPELSAWLVAEPAAEPLAQRLMLALHRDGRTADALEVFARTEKALSAYETEPRAELVALAAAIRRHDPTLDRPGPGLPGSRTRFIGRRAELDRAITLSGEARLLTVAGPGGSGKTRFALELAREVTADYDAVHVVELAGAGRSLLDAHFSAALGVRDEPGTTAVAAMARHLGDRRVLLVVDNCEHVRAESATVVDALLLAAPGVRVVATSREPLGVVGEVMFPLGGLSSADAVRLLDGRVAAARGGAGLRPQERPAATELCRRLDGLPLALELAAARLRALPLGEIVSRLDRRLDLLVGASPVERHRTMRAAIDWGYDLLDQPQQELLAGLSQFAGGFDLAAASHVYGADAFDPLTQLTDRSMVEWTGERYRLIETIREYAAELLAPGDPARRRFAGLWVERLAAPPPPDGPAHTEWLAEVGATHDSIVAALDWSLTAGDPADGLAMAAAMWWYWWVTGRMVEGRAWLGRALGAAPEPTALRARALRVAASLARSSGDLDEARRLGEQGLAAFRALGDRPGVIAALNNLLITAQGQADYPASLTFGYEALELAEADGNARMTAAALNNTAGTLRCLDRLDEAGPMFARALDAFRAINDARGTAAALSNLGIVARRLARAEASRAYMIEALGIYTELAIPEGQLDAIEGLAQLAPPAEALTLLVVAERERSALGSPIFTPDEVRDRDEAERTARAALSAEEAAEAYRAASALTWDEVVRRFE